VAVQPGFTFHHAEQVRHMRTQLVAVAVSFCGLSLGTLSKLIFVAVQPGFTFHHAEQVRHSCCTYTQFLVYLGSDSGTLIVRPVRLKSRYLDSWHAASHGDTTRLYFSPRRACEALMLA
jgi:hypothetical protein